MFTRRTLATIAVAAVTVPVAFVAPAAAAPGSDGVRTGGGCSGSAHWKLKAKPDDGRIEVEGQVDSNKSGQVWRWRFKHNGSVSAHGTKQTSGRSGSFEVQRRMTNLAGTDHFSFRAEHHGQVCRGTISF